MSETDETMGKRIARLRLEHGMTQERLADVLGVSAQAVSKWEHDLNYPDVTLLPSLAHLLGVSVDELLSGSEDVIDDDEIMPAPAPAQHEEQEEPTEPVHRGKWLHIITHQHTKEYGDVDVRIPLVLVRPWLKLGTNPAILAMGNVPEEAREAIAQLNEEALHKMIDLGELGTLIDVQMEEHDVKICVE